jgi:hypothetical protein
LGPRFALATVSWRISGHFRRITGVHGGRGATAAMATRSRPIPTAFEGQSRWSPTKKSGFEGQSRWSPTKKSGFEGRSRWSPTEKSGFEGRPDWSRPRRVACKGRPDWSRPRRVACEGRPDWSRPRRVACEGRLVCWRQLFLPVVASCVNLAVAHARFPSAAIVFWTVARCSVPRAEVIANPSAPA